MEEEALHILLLLGFNRSNRELIRQTAAGGLMPGQPKILEYLWQHNGCNQKDIGQYYILDKSTVTNLLKRMEKMGLIYRQKQEEDQRGISVFLTPEGWEKAAWVRQIVSNVDRHAWQGIPEREKQAFIKTFRKIICNQKEWEV